MSPDSEYSCLLLSPTLLDKFMQPEGVQHTVPGEGSNGAKPGDAKTDVDNSNTPEILEPSQRKIVVYRTLPGDLVIKPQSYRGDGKVTVEFLRNSGPRVYQLVYSYMYVIRVKRLVSLHLK